MKLYKIKLISRHNDTLVGEANGKKIPNAEFYFNKIRDGENVTPSIFDYFFLESFEQQEKWEIVKYDIHSFIGEGSQIRGWLISEKLKLLLDCFDLSIPHEYYTSKLLYKGEKYNYFVFQYYDKSNKDYWSNYLNYDKSIFFDTSSDVEYYVKSRQELIDKQVEILKKCRIINIIPKVLFVKKKDFYATESFLGYNIVSERLKNAIEANGIEGFEFSELDYEVVVDV
jgi:hypothetical protein